MTQIPEPKHSLANLIDKAHEAKPEDPRPHLGCSLLGHPCDRWLWLTFRWSVIEKFPGRILRLFRRGRMEEAVAHADLEAIGVEFEPLPDGEDQHAVDFGCHVSGSVDDIIKNGLPDALKTRHTVEYKTHSKKSFDDLVKHGVEKSKPQHWAQMQTYMKGRDVDRALYYAICKDDDRIHTERVYYDPGAATKFVDRGHKIALAERLPDPLSTDPTWYQCRFCAGHDFCHSTRMTREVNCRTCAHVTPESDGSWSCARHGAGNIPYDFQLTGCDSHVLHPDLVPWEMGDSDSPNEAVYIIDGEQVRNGETGESSRLLVSKIYNEEPPF